MREGPALLKWHIAYTKQAQRDAKKLAASGLRSKVEALLATVADNPYEYPPPYEKLVGDLIEDHSRRITIQHRLVAKHHPAGFFSV